MKINRKTRVIYVGGETNIETILHPVTGKCLYSGQSVYRLKKENPRAEVLFFGDAVKRAEKARAQKLS